MMQDLSLMGAEPGDMPCKAPGGETKLARGFPPLNLDDQPLKDEPVTPSESIYHIREFFNLGEIHSGKEKTPSWIESHCMCVTGLLPQHIRNLISTYKHIPPKSKDRKICNESG